MQSLSLSRVFQLFESPGFINDGQSRVSDTIITVSIMATAWYHHDHNGWQYQLSYGCLSPLVAHGYLTQSGRNTRIVPHPNFG